MWAPVGITMKPFLLYLCGFSKFYLFDVVEKSKFIYIKNYLNGIIDNIEVISNELQIDESNAIDKINELLSCNSKKKFIKYAILNL